MSILDVLRPTIERDAVEGFDAVTLLERRGGFNAYRDDGAVMDVPLLHPWANRLARDELLVHGRRVRLAGSPYVRRDEHGLAIHGLLGAHPGWSVHELDADGHAARLVAGLDFAADAELIAAFPFPHELVLEATVTAQALRIATTVRATGAVAVPLSFGFHPYLRIPGVDRADWEVRLPARRRFELDARGLPTGRRRREGAAAFRLAGRVFDDGYDGIGDGATFSVSGGGREIAVTFEHGYPAAQVFSPYGAEYICFEPMTAPTNALATGDGLRFVAPGESFSAAFSIAVRPRDPGVR